VTDLLDAGTVLVEFPVDRLVAEALRTVDRFLVPDMPDRLIAATAVMLGVPVLTCDARIIASGIATVW
jgi:predicted nucleic acid-binding protein